jgi:hypothetical protein
MRLRVWRGAQSITALRERGLFPSRPSIFFPRHPLLIMMTGGAALKSKKCPARRG